jgi:lipid II:glycine glycyltransferase (peptidoglycan interpeptide bridge formation enzyme)
VDGQTPESWSAILAQFDDANIYQSWAYGAVRWGARGLSHLVLRRDGQILGAAQVRIARVPLIPAGLAYLRWGPMCQSKGRPLDPAVVAEMVASLRQEYVNRRGLVLQIIPHAFSGTERAAAFQSALSQSGLQPEPSLGHYRTIVVDLGPTAEVLRKRLDQKWRNQLNRAEKNGLALEVSGGPEAYREFVRLYEVMWKRKRFETSVDVQEFARIQELLSGPARMQTFLATADGRSVAALVCSLMGDTAIYLLGATNEQARELKAAYFLQWQAMQWLKDRGACWYDLGGIDLETNPGGHHFKSGFGGTELTQTSIHVCHGGLLSAGVAALWAWCCRWRSSRSLSAVGTNVAYRNS